MVHNRIRQLGGDSEVMKWQLRDYRLHALGLVMLATGFGCATHPPSDRLQLSTQQTVAMVRAGQFAALNRHYAAIQARYDKGSISDEGLRAAFRHFYDSSPELAPRYESWVREMPNSYVAHLARAIYYVRVGEESRGDRFIAYTSDAQLDGMEAAFAMASRELQNSLFLERRPLLSVFYELDIGKFDGDAARNRQLLEASLAIDPKNFIVREMYMQTLTTAWGGSTDEMKAFVTECRRAGLSAAHIKKMESMVPADEAWIDEFRNENYKRAAAEYLEAARVSGEEGCLYCAGRAFVKANDFPDADRVLTQYLARDSESADVWALRAYVNVKLGRKRDAVRDYRHAADLGDADSQYALGTMYLVGEYGLPQDRAAGVQWLTRAAAQGNEAAKKLLPIALDKRIALLPGTTWGSNQGGH